MILIKNNGAETRTDWLVFYPQCGYHGCRQAEETVHPCIALVLRETNCIIIACQAAGPDRLTDNHGNICNVITTALLWKCF